MINKWRCGDYLMRSITIDTSSAYNLTIVNVSNGAFYRHKNMVSCIQIKESTVPHHLAEVQGALAGF